MNKGGYKWIAPAMVLLIAVGLIPFIIALGYSFRAVSHTDSTAKGQFILWDNYRRLMHDPDFFNSLKVSAKYMIPALFLQTGLGLAVALILAPAARRRRLVIPILLLPTLTPPVVTGLIGLLSLNPDFGIIGIYLHRWGLVKEAMLGSAKWALPAIILVDTWQWMPFIASILLSGLLSLPKEPYEAAQVDGANAWQIFRRVTLPLLRPYFTVAILIRAIDAFAITDIIEVMTRGGPGTVTEAISMYAYRLNFRYWHLGYGAANVMVIYMMIEVVIDLLNKVLTRRAAPGGA